MATGRREAVARVPCEEHIADAEGRSDIASHLPSALGFDLQIGRSLPESLLHTANTLLLAPFIGMRLLSREERGVHHPLGLAVVVDDQPGDRVRMVPEQRWAVAGAKPVRQVGVEVDPRMVLDDSALRIVRRRVDLGHGGFHLDAQGLADRRTRPVAPEKVSAPDLATATGGGVALQNRGPHEAVLLLEAFHEAAVAHPGTRRVPATEDIGHNGLQLRLLQIQLLPGGALPQPCHPLLGVFGRRCLGGLVAELIRHLHSPLGDRALCDLVHPPNAVLRAPGAFGVEGGIVRATSTQDLQGSPVDDVRRRR
mmetsp:Transcript_45268/g.131718  ORF Transcript_45268/g.131718 Transcript_45268/m.131718 type:complete len:310 (+) Transcript_45268:1139-2068(+)